MPKVFLFSCYLLDFWDSKAGFQEERIEYFSDMAFVSRLPEEIFCFIKYFNMVQDMYQLDFY